MSKEVIIRVRDDLDGSDADETLVFTVRGVSYEIDLSSANVELFDKSLQQFVEAARPQQLTQFAPLSKVPIAKRELMQRRREVRGWAARHGWPELQEQVKGRIPYPAIEAYMVTHPEVELPPELLPKRRAAGDLESVTAQQMSAFGDDEGVSAAKLVKQPYQTVSAATTAANRRKKFGDKLDGLDTDKRNEIRAWANKHGFKVPAQGIISTAVLEAYFEAEEN